MALLRRLYRIILLFGWFIFMALISLPFKLGGWNSVRRVGYCTRLWGRGIAWIINLRLKVCGDPASFQGGLIVSNHQSYLDIIAHAAIFPIRFMPKIEISRWPFLGWYLGISRPIWVDRSSRQKSAELCRQMCETMEHRIPLIIYPEGTTSNGRNGLLPFKSTPFEAIASTNVPILPIITILRDSPDGETLAWYGDAELLPHLWRLLGYRRTEAEIHLMPVIYPEGRNRKDLAADVREMMQARYWQVLTEMQITVSAPDAAASAFNPEKEKTYV